MARQSGVVLLLVAALLSSASVQAQGNFACKNSSSDGPDQSICSALRVPSSTPVESQCVKVGATDRYFCGMQNASCTEASQCDHGTCLITDPSSSVPGICTGGYAQNCIVDGAPSSSACLGTLGCSPRDGTCGGAGAVCDQQGLPDNNSCTSGMCDASTLRCAEPAAPALGLGFAALLAPAVSATGTLAQQVEATPSPAALEASATAALTAAATVTPSAPALGAPTATPAPTTTPSAPIPSGRLRARRHVAPACAGNMTACPVENFHHQTLGRRSRTYECIDTQTNLEKCGGCTGGLGGVDCTELDSQGAVACVEGVCVVSETP